MLGAVLVVVAITASCSSGGTAEQPAPTTSAAPPTTATSPHATVVATAAVPELEVYASRPEPDGSVQPHVVEATGGRAPLPRADLAQVGARKTTTGWVFENPTYYDKPLVHVVTAVDGDWVELMIPARPNGQTGWVRAADVVLSEHGYRGELDLSEMHLRMWDGDALLVETPVVIGRESSPTPVGRLYVNEILDTAEIGISQAAYGPWLLSTNAYSEALDLFDGGLPVIAFHGTSSPELVGTAVSNGCVRMPNEVITLLAGTIPAGTPIDVVE